MQRKKIYFIINPVSGASNKENIGDLINDHLDHEQFDFQHSYTSGKGHAIKLASQAASENFDIVVACGGDGTVNEVAQALVNTDTALAVIPNGSGNGFAMYIGMGRNLRKAILMLNDHQVRRIDSCTVNDRFFINLGGIGFDALIAYKVDSGKKRGFLMYFNTVVKEMLHFKAENFKIEIDGETLESPFTTIAVANAPMYGYNFTVAPLADMTDGLLDTVFIKKASLLRTLLASWRMLTGTLNKSSLVSIKKSKEVIITSAKPYYYHLDGESFEFEGKLHFRINPRSINVVFPSNSKILKN